MVPPSPAWECKPSGRRQEGSEYGEEVVEALRVDPMAGFRDLGVLDVREAGGDGVAVVVLDVVGLAAVDEEGRAVVPQTVRRRGPAGDEWEGALDDREVRTPAGTGRVEDQVL